ncbi:MAG: PadR family transcriptional regulator [Anaerolineae bacterium]|jgi:DNA-binding PadR family transcriptional regulator|nr:PadR family transcriptional regulator [Anaerolineae bacterium]
MTDAELTLLSLLAENPLYGYELQQLVDERGLREWLTIGFSSIYYILNKLEGQKLLTAQLHSEGRGPARKKYALTEAGRGVLQTAISSLLREPRVPGSGFELGLSNLHVLKPAQVYKVLMHHRDDLRSQLEHVSLGWSRYQNGRPTLEANIHALYTHSIAIMTAEIAWLDDFLARWQLQYPEVMQDLVKKNAAPVSDTGKLARAVKAAQQQEAPDSLKRIQRLRRIPRSPREG